MGAMAVEKYPTYSSAFKNPEPVKIQGLPDGSNGTAISTEEPFLSRDCQFLFFNSAQSENNKDLHYAKRFEDGWLYQREIGPGVNSQNIIQACTTLFIDYARYVDFGHYDKFVELFTDHAVLNLGFELQGKEKIRRSMTKRAYELRSRHVLSNISIDVQNETLVTGIGYLTLYRHIGRDSLQDKAVMLRGPAGVGHYSNTFELTNRGWRISSCHLQFAFRDPEQFPEN